MLFSPSDLRELVALVGFVALAMFGGAVAFVKALDLSENPPVKIRFFAELARRLFLACFVGVVMYAITKQYGPQPPLVWVVAALSGVFATEGLDFVWVLIKERGGAVMGAIFRLPPGPPPPPAGPTQ